MKHHILKLPEQSMIVGSEIKIFVRVLKKGKEVKLDNIVGILKNYKNKYSSIELQHKAREWWSNVPR